MQMTEFGKAIRILRIESNRKQKQDAEDFGVTASYISAIECGKKKVSDKYLECCIKTYGNKDRLTELAEKQNKSTEKIAFVRCRDCKYWGINYYRDIESCSEIREIDGSPMITSHDGYCSMGERKEG